MHRDTASSTTFIHFTVADFLDLAHRCAFHPTNPETLPLNPVAVARAYASIANQVAELTVQGRQNEFKLVGEDGYWALRADIEGYLQAVISGYARGCMARTVGKLAVELLGEPEEVQEPPLADSLDVFTCKAPDTLQ